MLRHMSCQNSLKPRQRPNNPRPPVRDLLAEKCLPGAGSLGPWPGPWFPLPAQPGPWVPSWGETAPGREQLGPEFPKDTQLGPDRKQSSPDPGRAASLPGQLGRLGQSRPGPRRGGFGGWLGECLSRLGVAGRGWGRPGGAVTRLGAGRRTERSDLNGP